MRLNSKRVCPPTHHSFSRFIQDSTVSEYIQISTTIETFPPSVLKAPDGTDLIVRIAFWFTRPKIKKSLFDKIKHAEYLSIGKMGLLPINSILGSYQPKGILHPHQELPETSEADIQFGNEFLEHMSLTIERATTLENNHVIILCSGYHTQ
jgi:hypothetical protein